MREPMPSLTLTEKLFRTNCALKKIKFIQKLELLLLNFPTNEEKLQALYNINFKIEVYVKDTKYLGVAKKTIEELTLKYFLLVNEKDDYDYDGYPF